MSFIIGSISQVAFNLLLTMYGFMQVLASVMMNQRIHSYVLIGVLLSLLLSCPAFYSQGIIEGFLYLSKLLSLVFIFYLAYLKPRMVLCFVALALISLFIIQWMSVGYGKTNQFPIIVLSLIAISWVSSKDIRIRYSGKLILFLLFVTVLQSIEVDSRTGIVIVLIVLLLLMLKKYKKVLFGLLVLLPFIYLVMMAFIGFLYDGGTHLLPPTISNLERSLMLYHLANNAYLFPFGINQELMTGMVNESMLNYGWKGYSSTRMDPHSFVAYLFMYSGWLGIWVFVVLQFQFFRYFIKVNNSVFILLIFPVAHSIISITLHPPDTIHRIAVVALFGAILRLYIYRSVK